MSAMNRLIYLFLTPLLLSGGVVCAQPQFEEGESFDDFRTRWNSWVESLPADERMHPELNAAVERFRDDREVALSDELSDYPMFVFSDTRPWNEDWKHIKAVREAYQRDLDRLLEVVQRPYLGAPIPTTDADGRPGLGLPSDCVTEHSLDSVSPLRSAMQYLCADAVYLAFHGEQDQALERFQLLDQLCQHAIEVPGKIQFLSAHAMRSMLEHTMVELVQYDPDLLNDAQLAEMQSIMLRHRANDFKSAFGFQQYLTHEDWRQQFHSVEFARTNADLRALYHQAASSYTGWYSTKLFQVVMKPELDADIPLATLDRQIAVQSRILEALMIDLEADLATQQVPEISTAIHKHLSGRDSSRFVPVYVDTALWRTQLGFMHRDSYKTINRIVVLALHRHRLRHGDWPQSLAAIDPETLPIPAIDLYSGEPLRYAVLNGKPRLWALGIDRDDDGGRHLPPHQNDSDRAFPHTWYALDEWDALSDERRAKYDGDLMILD